MEKQTPHKPKLEYMNYFRAITIIMIVLGHTVCFGEKGSFLCDFNTYIFKGGTFVFVFIAGFLFQYLSYKFEYKDYLKKKFLNVILPYLICITPAVIVFTLSGNNPSVPLYNMGPAAKILSSYLFGLVLNNPMWYIGMISIFFIFAPCLLFIKKHKKLWFTVLALSILLSIFHKRPSVGYAIYRLKDFATLNIYITFLKLYFNSFLFFSSSYLLGMQTCTIIDKYFDSIKKNIKFISIIFTSLYLAALGFYITSKSFIAYQSGHIFLTFMLLSFCIMFENFINSKPHIRKMLGFLAEYSFGIFFVHQYFINLILYHSIYDTFKTPFFNINQNTFAAFAYTWSTFFISLICSLFALCILKKFLNKLNIKNTRRFIGV